MSSYLNLNLYKMKKKYFLLLGLCVILMSSCAFYEKTSPVFGYEDNSIKTNVTADLDVTNARKVSENIETQTLFGFIPLQHNGHKYLKSSNRYGALNKSESQVLYKLKQNSGADIILDPEFTSERHSWFLGLYKTTKITVDGWAVKVNKLHN